MNPNSKNIVIISPFIIIVVNIITAIVFGKLIGKWSFIPLILIEWILFLFFILRYGQNDSIRNWLKYSNKNWGWNIVAIIIGLIPLPIFLKYNYLLSDWSIWIPWIILALVNPWLEEFYWRGLLSDHTKKWNVVLSILFTSLIFSANHAVFGINSELFRGYEIFTSTFVMGIVWAITYRKTNSLRWVILSHFLVDFLNLSAPAFLDLFRPGF
ncbi:CPBP family intramembrane glutamic endopeptidase [Epilithonimonas sp.]|uniref:CPBP family intramembrane glutamic endopeptidase n=1 Tax=Epilithonimonas sp. TaxID=2894511 RepID=UPI002896C9CD|nr:CPBP family intramembrane glutamic endopeptidase [Epilithonimonas sp.]